MSFTVSIVLFQHQAEELHNLFVELNAASSVKTVWLVDNGGCGWAQNTCEFHKFRYVKSAVNGGYGYGHNLAIHQLDSSSSHHIICNPDIRFHPNELDQYSEVLNDYDDALIMPNIVYPSGERQELCKLLPTPLDLFARRFAPRLASRLDDRYLLRGADFSRDFFVPSLSGCFMVCRTDCLKAVNGFDERYFMYLEDIDLSRRLAEEGGARFLPRMTVIHCFNKGSYRNNKLLVYHLCSALKYFNKWGWIFDDNRRNLNARCLEGLPKKA